MKRWRKTLAAVVASIALAATATACHGRTADFDREAIVRVSCFVPTGVYVGTATHVGNGNYITAAHVIAKGSCSVAGEPIANKREDTTKDFATFTAAERSATMSYSCRGFKKQKDYLAVGYPGEVPGLVHEAWRATSFVFDKFRVFLGNAYPGMSGGPVVDTRGRITGIVNMRWPTRGMPLKDTFFCGKD